MITLADICEALDGHRLNDARIWIEGVPPGSALRFRMPGGGGGMSFRTRVALLILARAIQLDEDKPMH